MKEALSKTNILNIGYQSDLAVISQRKKICLFHTADFFYSIAFDIGGAFRLSTINKTSKKYSKNNCYSVEATGLFVKDATKIKFGAMSILTTPTCNVERQLVRIVCHAGNSKELTLARKQRKVAINANLACISKQKES